MLTREEKRIMKVLKDMDAHSLRFIAASADLPEIRAYCILNKLMTMHYVERDMFEPYYQGTPCTWYYRIFGTQVSDWVIRFPLFEKYRKNPLYGLYFTLFYNDKILI